MQTFFGSLKRKRLTDESIRNKTLQLIMIRQFVGNGSDVYIQVITFIALLGPSEYNRSSFSSGGLVPCYSLILSNFPSGISFREELGKTNHMLVACRMFASDLLLDVGVIWLKTRFLRDLLTNRLQSFRVHLTYVTNLFEGFV